MKYFIIRISSLRSAVHCVIIRRKSSSNRGRGSRTRWPVRKAGCAKERNIEKSFSDFLHPLRPFNFLLIVQDSCSPGWRKLRNKWKLKKRHSTWRRGQKSWENWSWTSLRSWGRSSSTSRAKLCRATVMSVTKYLDLEKNTSYYLCTSNIYWKYEKIYKLKLNDNIWFASTDQYLPL